MPDDRARRLLDSLRKHGSCLIAFSGGVDSAVVACAAQRALGERALAVTGVSASLSSEELETARSVAAQIGIRHFEQATDEFARPDYLRNAPDRCYHCKTELYTSLMELAKQHGLAVIANGANADDAADYRPGMRAATEWQVVSPLLECGLTKSDVRALAAQWGLPVWDKPASPCLSSRIAYGEEVTKGRLAMIEQAERWLAAAMRTCGGPRELRVRYHRGDMARIEVPAAALPLLIEPQTQAALLARFKELGFKFVTLDLEGFRSGSLNELVPLTLHDRRTE